MKQIFSLIFAITFILFSEQLLSQNTGIGTTAPNTGTIPDISSNTLGSLHPPMTAIQGYPISSPAMDFLYLIPTGLP